MPTLVYLMPSGRYLMEDFCYAGGLPAVMDQPAKAGLLEAGQLTVTGRSIGESVAGTPCWSAGIIRSFDNLLQPPGSATAVRTASTAGARSASTRPRSNTGAHL